MRSNVLVVAALTMLAAATCHAADAPAADRAEKAGAKLREKFDAADINHDGLLTRDEAAKGLPHAAKHFDEIDANHDGRLSVQEVAQYLRAKRAARAETP